MKLKEYHLLQDRPRVAEQGIIYVFGKDGCIFRGELGPSVAPEVGVWTISPLLPHFCGRLLPEFASLGFNHSLTADRACAPRICTGPGEPPGIGLGWRAASVQRSCRGFCRGSRILVGECDILLSEIIPFI